MTCDKPDLSPERRLTLYLRIARGARKAGAPGLRRAAILKAWEARQELRKV
jgi:hypothetical protein